MRSCTDPGIVDVDAVGHDGDLAAGLVEVVELLGDPTRLRGGAGAEVRGQHRERRCSPRRAWRSAAIAHHDQDDRRAGGARRSVRAGPSRRHPIVRRWWRRLPARQPVRCGVARRAGRRRRALDGEGARGPNTAWWRSASTITWEVIEPAAGPERRGRGGPQERSMRRIGHGERLAEPDGGAADRAHDDQGWQLSVRKPTSDPPTVRPTPRAAAVAAGPAEPVTAVDPADDGLDRAEHGAADQTHRWPPRRRHRRRRRRAGPPRRRAGTRRRSPPIGPTS